MPRTVEPWLDTNDGKGVHAGGGAHDRRRDALSVAEVAAAVKRPAARRRAGSVTRGRLQSENPLPLRLGRLQNRQQVAVRRSPPIRSADGIRRMPPRGRTGG